MAEQHHDQHSTDPFEDEDSQTRSQFVNEFFHHYWPMVLFGTLFILMCAFPMILGDFSSVLALPALAIIAVFGIALTLTFTVPALLPVFVLLVAGVVFALAPESTYNRAGIMLGVGVLGMAFLGSLVFFRKIRESDPAEELAGAEELKMAPIETTETDALEEAATASAAAPEEKKGPKPVAFDLGIASKGVTIIFGTESGNAEGLAEMAKGRLEGDGHAVQILDASVVDAAHLKAFANLLVITSTWGEGDPPSNALDLVADLKNEGLGLSTAGIQFSVCGLGDTSYELFCQCGKDFDSKLEQYGGKRFHPRVDCDVDFEGPFQDWLGGVAGALKGGLNTVVEYQQEAVTA